MKTSPDSHDVEPLRPDLMVSWWLPVTTMVLFMALGQVCRGANTLALDLDVSHWVQRRSSGWADHVATVGNFLGEAPLAISLLVIAAVGGFALKRRRELLFLLVVAIGRLLAIAVKSGFDSPRPNGLQVHLEGVFSGYGFPSGHTLTSTLSIGTLVFLVAGRSPGSHLHWFLLIPWAVAFCITGFARIYVGAHWFTDTLGGALLGVSIVLLAANISGLLTSRLSSRQPEAISA